jgi:sugar lactone lactonase YvrE
MDEFRVWNTARTQAQIQANRSVELVGNEAGLLTYYNFNQGTSNGSNIATLSDNQTVGTVLNGTLTNFALSGNTSNFINPPSIGVTVAGSATSTSGSTAALLSNPTFVYVDSEGSIYVSDQSNHRIQKFPAGSVAGTSAVTIAGGNGLGVGANQLYNPLSFAFDAAKSLYVADQSNNRIQKFPVGSTSSTSAVTVAGGNLSGYAYNQFSNPTGVYIDNAGYLFVTDQSNYRLLRFPPNSTSTTNGVMLIGNLGSANTSGGLYNPLGPIVIDTAGNIYVSDQSNHRIQKYKPLYASTAYQPVAAGSYTATVTSYNGCVSTSSNSISISPVASVTASASASKICVGTSVTFTATATSGGSSPTYQWYKNGTTVGTGLPTYTDASLNNNDSVWVTLNASISTCGVGTSNKL